jgi:hypothetical protein
MAYLEGQIGGSSVVHSRSQSPACNDDDDDSSDDNDDNHNGINQALWQKYRQACSESQQLLSTLER